MFIYDQLIDKTGPSETRWHYMIKGILNNENLNENNRERSGN